MHSINDNELLQADLTACVRTLREGGLILYPTDTIWGIGCDATSDAAVRRAGTSDGVRRRHPRHCL